MDVSVVVPTRNRSRLLATALRSVLGQRDVELEVIVVDDASTDDTAAVVASHNDARLRLVRHDRPLGPNAARNRGAADAAGRWVAFIDDDDAWAPDKLARQLRAAEEAGRDWVYAGSVNVNDRLEVIHGVPPPSPGEVAAALPRYNAIPASASNVVIRRDAFAAQGGFNEALRACEEWDLWLRLLRGGQPAWVQAPLVAYRMHAGNAILDVRALIEGAHMIERLHDTAIDWGQFHRWTAQLCLRGGRRGDALWYYLRATVGGQGRQVATELSRATRRKLGRGGSLYETSSWAAEATVWLDELRRLDAAEVSK